MIDKDDLLNNIRNGSEADFVHYCSNNKTINTLNSIKFIIDQI